MIDILTLAIPFYFALIAIELAYQYFSKVQLYRLGDFLNNISNGTMDQIFSVFTKLSIIAIYHFVFTNFRFFTLENTLVHFFLLLFLADFAYYWYHRLSHEMAILWMTHSVHHQSEDYNISVALRQSVIDGTLYFFYIPLALLGFPTELLVLVAGVAAIYGVWVHTELIRGMGFLDYWFNTPSNHRVHHGRNPIYIDKNYGGILMIWDHVFNTYQPETEEVVYGITKPLQTFNPVAVQLSYPIALLQKFLQTKGFWNKLKTIYKKPGWEPGKETEFFPNVSRNSVQKYDVGYSDNIKYYVILQFAIATGFISYFLNVQHLYPNTIKLPAMFFSVWALANMSLVLMKQTAILKWEALRILLTGSFLLFINSENSIIHVAISTLTVLNLGFLIFLYLSDAKKQTTVQEAIPQ